MTKYILNRFADLAVVFILISAVTFLLIYFSPGDPAQVLLERGGNVHSEEEIDALREHMGINEPIHILYCRWMQKIAKLDFGKSYINGEPVLGGILARFPVTLKLAVLTFLFIILVTIPVGIITAYYRDSWLDYGVRALILTFSSIPGFLLAIILIYFLSIRYPLFPVLMGSGIKGYILPVFSLGTGLALLKIRLFRAAIIETLQEDFVRNLRAMGLSEYRIMFSYVIKNSMIPAITSLGITLGNLLTGTVIIETVFGLNGIGKYAIDAIFNKDYNVILGYVVISSVIFVVANLLIDMIYASIDPRITLKG